MKLLRAVLFSLLVIVPFFCWANEEPPLPPKLEEELKTAEIEGQNRAFSDRFTEMLFYLASLVAVMYGGSWIVKKMIKDKSIPQSKTNSLIKVVETERLSLKTTLYLVDHQGQKLIVAESSTGQISITKLCP